jgi:hypothetical protein
VTELPDGGREAKSVFEIGDVEDLRLVNPYLAHGSPGRMVKLRFTPIYRRVHSFHKVGDLMMALVPAEPAKGRSAPDPDAPAPPPPSPLELQKLRDLQPMIADMLAGFEVKLKLALPKPVSLGHIRDRRSATKVINLLWFREEDLDAFGNRFLENEELMLSLLRLKMDADNLTEQTQGFPNNRTVPVFRGKFYASGRFRIKPTKALFKKYYAGRPKSQGGDRPEKSEAPEPAQPDAPERLAAANETEAAEAPSPGDARTD